MKVTVQTIFDLYKDDGKWVAEELNERREICCDYYDSDRDNEWDCYKYTFDIPDDILREWCYSKEGLYWYYVEFDCITTQQCTMDGTEYDVEYDVKELRVKYLGKNNESPNGELPQDEIQE